MASEITQADRDLAAGIIIWVYGPSDAGKTMARITKEGGYDDAAHVAACAMHRTAAVAELVEAANAAFDFLGGVDDAAEMRAMLLAALSRHQAGLGKGAG